MFNNCFSNDCFFFPLCLYKSMKCVCVCVCVISGDVHDGKNRNSFAAWTLVIILRLWNEVRVG